MSQGREAGFILAIPHGIRVWEVFLSELAQSLTAFSIPPPDKKVDKARFATAWARLAAEGAAQSAEDRVLSGTHELAARYPDKPVQGSEFEDVDILIGQAMAAEEPMHAEMRTLVEKVGGTYERGPLKAKARILEKCYRRVSARANQLLLRKRTIVFTRPARTKILSFIHLVTRFLTLA